MTTKRKQRKNNKSTIKMKDLNTLLSVTDKTDLKSENVGNSNKLD